MAAEVPEVALDLYAVPPEGFVAARNELAKQLRDDGEAETAATVAKLRRPTVAAAVVNAAARAHLDLVEELLASGSALAAAQRKLLAKKSGAAEELREAADARRKAIRALVDAALTDAEAAGRPADHLRDEVAGTFEAATLEEDLAERVRLGAIEKTAVPSAGLAGVEGFSLIPGGAESAGGSDDTADPEPAQTRASRVAQEAADAARSARKAADEAAAAATRAAEEADRLAGIAEETERAARAARVEERRLRDEASTARRRAERAERAARSAAERASRSNR